MLDDPAALDRVFSALAAPARRTLVTRLERGPASVSELAEPLDMTLAAVVQHVQVLAASGVVRTEKIGRVRLCHLRPAALAEAARWLTARQEAFWRAGLREVDHLLDDDDAPSPKKEAR